MNFNKRILILHNKYLQKGGEDKVVHSEFNLLKSKGVVVELMELNNDNFLTSNPFLASLSLFRNQKSERLIQQKLINFNPDIIHIHNLFYTITPSIINTIKKYKKEIILTIHNYRLVCPSSTLYHNNEIYEKNLKTFFPIDGILKGVFQESILKTFLLSCVIWGHRYLGTWKKVDKYIFLTNFARKKIKESSLKLNSSKLFVKSNYIQTPKLQYESSTLIKNQFIFIGRLSHEKGVGMLLACFSKVDYSLIIYGDGPLNDRVQIIASESNNIQYKGFQPYHVLKQDLYQSRALIFPSIWYEGMPMTILESFSLGTPVIASDLGSMTEIIETNTTGILFPPNDIKRLEESLDSIVMMSDEKYYEMRENVKDEHNRKYSENQAYNDLINIYMM